MGIGCDQVHVVLDQHDPLHAGALSRSDQRLHDAVLVGSGNAGSRFVEQDHLRVERKSRGNIEQLFLALRKRRGNCVEPVAEAEDFRYLAHAAAHLAVGGKPREKPPTLLLPRNDCGCDRLLDRQLGKNLDELERARQAMIGKFDRPHTGNILAHEQDLPGARLEQPGEQIDQRGLAGAIGAHDRDPLTLMHGHVDLFKREEGAVGFADVARFKQQGHAVLPAIQRRRSAANPAMPSGNAMTISARMAPSTKRQYSVSDCSWSCNKVKVSAPTIGPKKFENPPSTAMKTSWPD